jgi:uncharacterized Tic20 family protein
MAKRSLIFSYVLLIALAILGAWLNGQFTGSVETMSNLRVLLGLVLLIGSLIGLVFLIRNHRKPMGQEQKRVWENIRSRGKGNYIRGFMVRGLAMGFGCQALILFKDYSDGKALASGSNILLALLVLLTVFIGGSYYAAIKIWDYHESEYHTAPQSQRVPSLK